MIIDKYGEQLSMKTLKEILNYEAQIIDLCNKMGFTNVRIYFKKAAKNNSLNLTVDVNRSLASASAGNDLYLEAELMQLLNCSVSVIVSSKLKDIYKNDVLRNSIPIQNKVALMQLIDEDFQFAAPSELELEEQDEILVDSKTVMEEISKEQKQSSEVDMEMEIDKYSNTSATDINSKLTSLSSNLIEENLVLEKAHKENMRNKLANDLMTVLLFNNNNELNPKILSEIKEFSSILIEAFSDTSKNNIEILVENTNNFLKENLKNKGTNIIPGITY